MFEAILVSMRQKTALRGFTIFELIFTIAIIGTLAGIVIPVYSNYKEKTEINKAILDIRSLESDILTFKMTKKAMPGTLVDVGKGGLLDPWGNPYKYLDYATSTPGQTRKDRFLKPLNSDFDLFSMGKDGDYRATLNNPLSQDDIVRANDGVFIGLGSEF